MCSAGRLGGSGQKAVLRKIGSVAPTLLTTRISTIDRRRDGRAEPVRMAMESRRHGTDTVRSGGDRGDRAQYRGSRAGIRVLRKGPTSLLYVEESMRRNGRMVLMDGDEVDGRRAGGDAWDQEVRSQSFAARSEVSSGTGPL